MLEYKAARYGRTFQRIDRFNPSTQSCSAFGAITGPKGLAQLSIRSWTCTSCATLHDRDHNASQNILATGRA
jgi:putative transposase